MFFFSEKKCVTWLVDNTGLLAAESRLDLNTLLSEGNEPEVVSGFGRLEAAQHPNYVILISGVRLLQFGIGKEQRTT